MADFTAAFRMLADGKRVRYSQMSPGHYLVMCPPCIVSIGETPFAMEPFPIEVTRDIDPTFKAEDALDIYMAVPFLPRPRDFQAQDWVEVTDAA